MLQTFDSKRFNMTTLLCSTIGLLAVFLFPVNQAVADPPFQEGEWEVTTSMEIPGMPFTPPPMTFQQCLTSEESVPQKKDPSQDCKMLEQKASGDTVDWKMRCKTSGGTTDAKGKVTYTGESMKGTTHITSKQGGEQMNMTSHMQGRRLGPCKE